MKNIKILLLLFLITISLSGCSKKPLNIFITSDIHYFSKELHDEGEMYTKSLVQTPMLIEKSVEIFDEFVEVIKKENPPYLIVAGDLTFNGELQSLKDLSLKFKEIEESGTEIIAIPGNHDMYYKDAYKYSLNTYEETPYITDEDYQELMGEFGFNQALYQDDYSFSYVYELDKDNYVLMLDANHIGSRGSIAKGTLAWIDELMPKLEGKHVFAVCHQPIYAPFDQAYFGYNVYNDRDVVEKLNNWNIDKVYVGHIHSERDKTEHNIHQQTVTSLLVDDIKYSSIQIKKGEHTFNSYNFSTYTDEGLAKHELVRNKQ